MPLPFHVSCVIPSIRLFELADGRFQQIEEGAVGPWCSGHGYLLVEQAMADFFREAKIERLTYEFAVVFNPRSGQEDRSRVRIRVGQFFNAGRIWDLPLDGPRLLTMGDAYIFASPDLKELLIEAGFDYLRFSEGLSDFAAAWRWAMNVSCEQVGAVDPALVLQRRASMICGP
jgi:hypothetical protein